jgi:hypothetical protein
MRKFGACGERAIPERTASYNMPWGLRQTAIGQSYLKIQVNPKESEVITIKGTALGFRKGSKFFVKRVPRPLRQ